MPATQTAFRVSFVLGIAILLLAIYTFSRAPVQVCGGLPRTYNTVTAFELARSTADLHAIFGNKPSECRNAVVVELDNSTKADSIAFIPLYGAFLIAFFLGIRAREQQLASVAALITLVTCVADYIENICLFSLSANPDEASNALTVLMWATEVKWVGLGITGMIGTWVLSKFGGWWRLAIPFGALGLIAPLITIPQPAIIGPYLGLAVALSWIPLLIANGRESFRSSKNNVKQ
jgi:hypothetical protein